MKGFATVLAALALMGCVEQSQTEPTQQKTEFELSQALVPGCYTVDLFDPYTLEYPGEDVSVEYRRFLGVWKNGAWGGEWCQDIYITKIYPDGSVDLIDAHGPFRAANIEATVFKRKGRIRDGVLTFSSFGKTQASYQLGGSYLVGRRKDYLGDFEITMNRTEGLAWVPIPPKNPRRT